MPQIHSAYSSQLELTAAALATINIAKGCASGQQGPLTMTLIFNDENKLQHTLPRSGAHAHTHTPHYTSILRPTASLGFVRIPRCTNRALLHIWRAEVTSREIQWTKRQI